MFYIMHLVNSTAGDPNCHDVEHGKERKKNWQVW